MASTRGMEPLRDRWKDDGYRRGRADPVPHRSHYHRTSPPGRHQVSDYDYDDVKPPNRSSHRLQRRSRDRDDYRSSSYSSPRSPPLEKRGRDSKARSRKTYSEHYSQRSKNRYDSPSAYKRRRSRSMSFDRSHSYKHRRTQSRSPYRSISPAAGAPPPHSHRQDRSTSPSLSPNDSSRFRGRDHHRHHVHRYSDNSITPPPRHRRTRSPESRRDRLHSAHDRSISPAYHIPERYVENGRGRKLETSSKRIQSPRHYEYSPPRKHSYGRRSPAPSKSRDVGRNEVTEYRYKRYSDHGGRKGRYNQSPPPKSTYSRPHSRRDSLSPPRKWRGSSRSRETSPTSNSGYAAATERGPIEESSRSSPSPPFKTRQRDFTADGKGFSASTNEQIDNRNHARPPSPPRPIPSFTDETDRAPIPEENEHIRQNFPMHGMRAEPMHDHSRQVVRPAQIDTRQPYQNSSPYMGPNSAQHSSPQSASPYGHGRGWNGHQSQYPTNHGHGAHPYAPQQAYRTHSYPPPSGSTGPYYPPHPSPHQAPYVSPHGHPQHGPPNHSFRGNHHSFRGGHFGPPQDHSYAGPPQNPQFQGHRGRGGYFTNLHWNAGGGHGREHAEHGDMGSRQVPFDNTHMNRPTSPDRRNLMMQDEAENPDENPFRPSKDLRVEDERAPSGNATNEYGNGIQKMLPPSRPAPASEEKGGPKISFSLKSKNAPPPKPDVSQRMREAPTHRDHISPDNRWTKRQSHGRFDAEKPSPSRYAEPRKERRIMTRVKPRPELTPEFAASTSIYFRKPGNESVVGSGTYGKVFKAIHVYTKELVALKKIRMEGERDGFPVTAVREIKLLQSLKHENIVKLQEVMVEKNDCFMVFEYLSHDLTGLLNHPTFKLEQAHKKHLAKQLFEGLDYLHRRGVLHRDIKAANILISNEGQLKLADFGLARFYAKRRQLDYTNRVITIWYRSPELLLGETQYGAEVDIWSAACVLIEIFTKHAIFPGDGGEINQLDKIYNMMGTPTRADWPGIVEMAWFELLRPTERKPSVFADKYKERVTPEAFDLLCSMFQYDPANRPSASDILEHPYFTAEHPPPEPAIGLRDLEGEWHEFESKALRRENERRDREARRGAGKEQSHRDREREKRKAAASVSAGDREAKRHRVSEASGP
ncbi:MAG: hypothetical protein M1825_005791 [Sarcosagium campestre]|nr:MAG: hypothetical protein M1825_005791 [Sarcosagium campestre]